MLKKIICILLACLMLLVFVSCQDDKTNEPSTTESATNAPEGDQPVAGEPTDPNNQYAKDNNAYYMDDWKR